MDPGMLFLTRGGGSDSSPSLTHEFVLVFLSPCLIDFFPQFPILADESEQDPTILL